MIATLTGLVTQIGPTSVVVDIGGFGVLAVCGPHISAGLRVGATVTLATSLVVREDSLTLYAFGSADERELFDLLLTATGIGPKIAQAALAVLPPDELRLAVATEDLARLTRVPGIGRKGAQRLVLELKDKMVAVAPPGERPPASRPVERWREQVASGLQGLGWPARDAERACTEVEHLAAGDDPASVPALMRAALRALARK